MVSWVTVKKNNKKTLKNKGFFVIVPKKHTPKATARNKIKRRVTHLINESKKEYLHPFTVRISADVSEIEQKVLKTTILEALKPLLS